MGNPYEEQETLSLSANIRLTLTAFALFGFSTMNICRAQVDADSLLALIPDSTFEAGTILVWFQDGYLDLSYLGCPEGEEEYEYPWADGLPLSTDFILDEGVVDALENLGVYRIDKMIKYLDPCRDTISIAVRGDTVYIPDFYNILVMKYDGDLRAPEACWSMLFMFGDAVKYAEPNYYLHPANGEPSSNSFSKAAVQLPNEFQTTVQPDLLPFNDAGVQNGGVNVVNAWDRVQGDPDIRIGIIDNGIDYSIQDFGSTGQVVVDGRNYITGGSNYNTNSGHGDAIASIIGALTNDGKGMAGVAGGWSGQGNAKLIAQKIYDLPQYIATAERTAAAIIGGATDLGAGGGLGLPSGQDVEFECEFLNLSLKADVNAPHSEVVRAAMGYAYSNDVIPVAAMDDNRQRHDWGDQFPTDVDDRWVVAISGTNTDGENHDPTFGTAYGPMVDFAAPYDVYAYSKSFLGGGPDYGYVSGTSFATPLAVGCFSLLRAYQKYRYNEGIAGNIPLNVPDYLAPEDYVNIFALSAINVYDPNPTIHVPYREEQVGYGVIDVGKAMEYIEPPYSLVHLDLIGELDTTWYSDEVMYMTMPKYYVHPGPGIDNLRNSDIYDVKRFSVEGRLYYGQQYPGTIRAWARGAASIGMEFPRLWNQLAGTTLSQRFPIYLNANWAEVTDWTDQYVDVRTFIYQRRRHGTTDQFQWVPGYAPKDVRFAISLIHTVPVSVGYIPELGFNISAIYPSPSKDLTRVSVSLQKTATVSIALYDLYGRRVTQIRDAQQVGAGAEVIQFNVGNLPSGTYFLRAVVDGRTITQKMAVYH